MKQKKGLSVLPALVLALALILSLAACGGSGGGETTAPDTTAAGEGTSETADAPADEPTDAPQDDGAAVAALTETLVGEWGFPGDAPESAFESLTFRADGTGVYKSLPSDKTLSFTYAVSIDHRTYNNGAAYTENMLHMAYDSGESEDFIFFFNEKGQMAFHNSENGGYHGVMDNLDVFTKY